jgi:hypothetical protein
MWFLPLQASYDDWRRARRQWVNLAPFLLNLGVESFDFNFSMLCHWVNTVHNISDRGRYASLGVHFLAILGSPKM